jgi:hypothetical protein
MKEGRTVLPSALSPPHIDRKDIFQLPLHGESKRERSQTMRSFVRSSTSRNRLTGRDEDNGPFETLCSMDSRDDDFLKMRERVGVRGEKSASEIAETREVRKKTDRHVGFLLVGCHIGGEHRSFEEDSQRGRSVKDQESVNEKNEEGRSPEGSERDSRRRDLPQLLRVVEIVGQGENSLRLGVAGYDS